jgi:hypothetical protein
VKSGTVAIVGSDRRTSFASNITGDWNHFPNVKPRHAILPGPFMTEDAPVQALVSLEARAESAARNGFQAAGPDAQAASPIVDADQFSALYKEPYAES